MKHLTQLVHFPPKVLYLCLEQDCGEVGNSNSYCPACNSTALLSLTKVLNREPKKDEAA